MAAVQRGECLLPAGDKTGNSKRRTEDRKTQKKTKKKKKKTKNHTTQGRETATKQDLDLQLQSCSCDVALEEPGRVTRTRQAVPLKRPSARRVRRSSVISLRSLLKRAFALCVDRGCLRDDSHLPRHWAPAHTLDGHAAASTQCPVPPHRAASAERSAPPSNKHNTRGRREVLPRPGNVAAASACMMMAAATSNQRSKQTNSQSP